MIKELWSSVAPLMTRLANEMGSMIKELWSQVAPLRAWLANGKGWFIIVSLCVLFVLWRKYRKRNRVLSGSFMKDCGLEQMRNDVVKAECERLFFNMNFAILKNQNDPKILARISAKYLFDLLECASSHDHHIEKVDLFSYRVARVRINTEERATEKVACELDASRSGGTPIDTISVWDAPIGEQKQTYVVEECDKCHGHERIKCPKCHGEHTHWECQKCHGESGIKYKCTHCDGRGEVVCEDCRGTRAVPCSSCHGSGEEKRKCVACEGTGSVWQKTGEKIRCFACKGSGKEVGVVEDYPGQHPCPRCKGKGWLWKTHKLDCPECHGKGEVVRPCRKCSGRGNVSCETCHATGVVRCKTCSGKGEISCEMCDSTGMAYCHTCGGKGDVVCPKCHGDGAFAFSWHITSKKTDYEEIRAWSSADVPDAVLPKLFPDSNNVNGCSLLYHAESSRLEPDDAMVLSETALRYPQLKKIFDEISGKFTCGDNLRVTSQNVDVVEVHDIARVEIKTDSENLLVGKHIAKGTMIVCWLNLSSGELLDIGLKADRPDEWYRNHALSDSNGSPYRMLNKAEEIALSNGSEAFEIWKLAYKMGNPIGMARYGECLCTGRTPKGETYKKQGAMLLALAEYLGVERSPHAKNLDWSTLPKDFWEDVVPRFAKIARFCKDGAWKDGCRIASGACADIRTPVYPLQYLPAPNKIDIFRDNGPDEMERRNAGLAALSSWGEFSKDQQKELAGVCPRAFEVMKSGTALSPRDFGLLLSCWRSVRDELIKSHRFWRIAKKYTIIDWVEFLSVYNGVDAEDLFVSRVNWKRIDEVPSDCLIELTQSETWSSIFDKVNWNRLSFDKLVLLSIKCPEVNKQVKWRALKSKIKTYNWLGLSDDQRVDFAIEHEAYSEIVLKSGFDPNKLRPWCLDLAYDKWPDRMSTFNPDAYDWTQCSPRLWAQIVYGHPEFEKYCHVDKIDWHALDHASIKYWRWALGAFGEKVVSYFSKWEEISDDWWNNIVAKQPALLEYRKKYCKKA